jgi:hypothetical protein
MPETRSVLYDGDDNEVDDEAVAVRGVVYEVDENGERGRVLDEWHAERSGAIDPPS